MSFKIYPTLLNSFIHFINETKGSSGNILVDYQELMDKINKVQKPRTEAQQRGVSFEEALVTGKGAEQFPIEILTSMKAKLPEKYRTQVYVQSKIEDVLLYGFVDIVAGKEAFDIKTTRSYKREKFVHDAQNMYLLGLEQYGIERLHYLITDMHSVYVETYELATYDFGPLKADLKLFTEFLTENKKKITNVKIFNEKDTHGQLSLF